MISCMELAFRVNNHDISLVNNRDNNDKNKSRAK